MLRLSLLLISLIIFAQNAFTQQYFEEEIKSALKEKPKLDFKLDSRSAFISQSGVRVFGLKLGFTYANKLTFGLGYNQLLSNVKREIVYQDSLRESNLGYYYFSPYVDYTFYRDEKWELSIPVQIGLGETFYRTQIDEKGVTFAKGIMFSYEPAITFQYRFLNYFGAGAGVGYRLVIIKNSSVEENFTSPMYLFKFKIYFQEIYQDIFHK